jgi:uncharacterized metal-binding protein
MKSGRKEHLAANAKTALQMGRFTFGLYLALAFGSVLPWWHCLPAGLLAYSACGLMEHWASPDRDLEENRKWSLSKAYWWFYGGRVDHRSIWSHSLLLGLPVRLLWGFWPVLLPIGLLAPTWLAPVLIGAIASDYTHLRLDGYTLPEMLL